MRVTQLRATRTKFKVRIFPRVVRSYRTHVFERIGKHPEIELSIQGDSTPLDHGHRRRLAPFLTAGAYRTRQLGPLLWQEGITLRGLGPGDVAVLWGGTRLLNNYVLSVACRARGIGVVWWGHGRIAGSSERQFARRRRLVDRLSDVVLLYMEHEVAAWVENRPHASSGPPVLAAHNAIDTDAVADARSRWGARRLADFRASHGLGSTPLLLFSGRNTPKAELGTLLSAFSAMIAAGRDLKLALIGPRPDDTALLARLDQLAIRQHTVLVAETYDEETLAPWFLSSAMLVYPGSIGLSLLHAFAYDLRVITHANAREQMPEFGLLVPGVNGWTFEQGNPRALQSVIASALESPPVAAEPATRSDLLNGHTAKVMALNIIAAALEAHRITNAKQLPARHYLRSLTHVQ